MKKKEREPIFTEKAVKRCPSSPKNRLFSHVFRLFGTEFYQFILLPFYHFIV